MKLSEWAKLQGISYKTAWRMWRDGRLPVPAEQMATGTVIIHPPVNTANGVALYLKTNFPVKTPPLGRSRVGAGCLLPRPNPSLRGEPFRRTLDLDNARPSFQ